jgi:hypothetical protein
MPAQNTENLPPDLAASRISSFILAISWLSTPILLNVFSIPLNKLPVIPKDF